MTTSPALKLPDAAQPDLELTWKPPEAASASAPPRAGQLLRQSPIPALRRLRVEETDFEVVIDGTVGRLRGDLHHYSMDSIDHHVRKAVAYSSLFAQERLSRGRAVNWAELGGRPLWRFLRSYVLRLGFLDGWAGWVVARMVAFETFLRYAKLREAQQAARSGKNSTPNS